MLKAPEEDGEEIEEATESLAAAKKIYTDTVVSAFLSQFDCIFILEGQLWRLFLVQNMFLLVPVVDVLSSHRSSLCILT